MKITLRLRFIQTTQRIIHGCAQIWNFSSSVQLDTSRVRYKVDHEKRNSISTSSHVLFCLLYKHTNDDFFGRFSKDFRTLSEDFRRFSKSRPKARKTFPNIFRKFPKISEDYRIFPKISEDYRRLQRKIRRCFDHTSTDLKVLSHGILSYFGHLLNSQAS